MGSKRDPGKFDCYEKALPDEPMFILLGRDPQAPALVRQWAERRRQLIQSGNRPRSDMAMVEEAEGCALVMESWRLLTDGKWREPSARHWKFKP